MTPLSLATPLAPPRESEPRPIPHAGRQTAEQQRQAGGEGGVGVGGSPVGRPNANLPRTVTEGEHRGRRSRLPSPPLPPAARGGATPHPSTSTSSPGPAVVNTPCRRHPVTRGYDSRGGRGEGQVRASAAHGRPASHTHPRGGAVKRGARGSGNGAAAGASPPPPPRRLLPFTGATTAPPPPASHRTHGGDRYQAPPWRGGGERPPSPTWQRAQKTATASLPRTCPYPPRLPVRRRAPRAVGGEGGGKGEGCGRAARPQRGNDDSKKRPRGAAVRHGQRLQRGRPGGGSTRSRGGVPMRSGWGVWPVGLTSGGERQGAVMVRQRESGKRGGWRQGHEGERQGGGRGGGQGVAGSDPRRRRGGSSGRRGAAKVRKWRRRPQPWEGRAGESVSQGPRRWIWEIPSATGIQSKYVVAQ